jgi:ribosomal protein S18 acetylase RimI-like enzyme
VEWRRADDVVSDDPRRIDRARVRDFIASSYWASNIPQATLDKAIDHSLCFGVYRGEHQVGFARVVTDRATFAYLCDVWIDAAHRGAGLGKWLVECVLSHPELQGLRRMSLVTRDAHSLYQAFGFKPMPDATRYLEKTRPNPYGGG